MNWPKTAKARYAPAPFPWSWSRLGVLGGLRDARRLQAHEKGATGKFDLAVLGQNGVHFGTPFFRNRPLGFQNGRPMIQYGHFSALESCALVQARCAFCKQEMF